ncbi:ATPase [Nocardioides psychrotolerans]|uniref:Ca2+-transporting ATPase n=1 Tax=Nocardioides psychrotolerans TaxID=1005945 RepID=A0A1I3JVN0_9ACTN|nr:cation-transporting P-type ATPase [Nocardioides psychrotolerans]GEP38330.1 ATPase [Nocardioides psychrotolerans]SFI64312.1 Ca2+-transporting ATPase [Nocardioides psychrotolerans]
MPIFVAAPVSAVSAEAVVAPDPHLRTTLEVVQTLAVDPRAGLDDAEVARRREMYGENRLAEHARRPAWARFLDQFRSLLILILIAAALLAGLIGDLKDTVVIGVVLLINATLGFVQENRAERSLEALRDMLAPTARVRRNGSEGVQDATALVPGDIVILEAGDRVPADGRLLVAVSVEVDESALTGESLPVRKGTAALPTREDKVPLAERTCMAYVNTALTRGRAELVVTAIGMRTEVGAIALMLEQGEVPKTPLQVQLDAVGKRIALIGGIAVTVYAALAFARGESLAEVALSAVALVVATVPEGLPAVLALTLALGVGRMARHGAIVKRLVSVETLGSATVVCSDKTGTLTLNQMTARALVHAGRHIRITGEGDFPPGALVDDSTGAPVDGVKTLLEPLVLCSDAILLDQGAQPAGVPTSAGIVGDPTEGALVVAAARAGIDVAALRADRPRIAELPFDSSRKFMATVHDEDGSAKAYLKGAPDVLLARSTSVLTAQGVRPLEKAQHDLFASEVSRLASQGLRVLAAATVILHDAPDASADPAKALADRLTGLTLLGLVGIADPPRPQARDAIALAHNAGVDVKMITGDHRDTANAIARELGIRGDVVTGTDIDKMTSQELSERIEGIGIFARVAPEHKVAIVRALTQRGHVVAMTGDGVNDAAALRAAHMGVAMGITGTEVTKQAGDMVLTDDNFATIIQAIGEGRSIYDNVVTFVRFQLSTNIGAILTFVGAVTLGMPAPLNAIQVLWVNIIMDGPPAIALGVDAPRPGLMDEPPRRSTERILNRTRLLQMLRAGLVMAIGTLGVLAVAREQATEAVALTMAFTTFVLFQFFNALNARVERRSVFTRHTFTNRWLWASLGAIVLLQVLVVQAAPLQAVFGTSPLSPLQWLICAAVASSALAVEEVIKSLSRTYGRRDDARAVIDPVPATSIA